MSSPDEVRPLVGAKAYPSRHWEKSCWVQWGVEEFSPLWLKEGVSTHIHVHVPPLYFLCRTWPRTHTHCHKGSDYV